MIFIRLLLLLIYGIFFDDLYLEIVERDVFDE